MAARNVKRVVSKVMSKSAYQLSESILARALSGDSTAQLAAVQLLTLGLSQDAK
jgi:hypothetical protein